MRADEGFEWAAEAAPILAGRLAPARRGTRKGRLRRWLDRDAWALFLAPAFAFHALAWIVPMLGAVAISVTPWNGIGLDRIQ